MISRFNRHGFSVSELTIAIVIIGCMIAFGFAVFNGNNLSTMSANVKQEKLAAALEIATKAIIAGDSLVSSTEACNAETMRDLYAQKLSNAKETEDISVNGKSLPALKVADYGVLAFDSSANCTKSWYSVPAASSPENVVNNNGSIATGGNSSGGGNNSDTSDDSSYMTTTPPVVIYSILDDKTKTASVPTRVTASKSAASNNQLTANTMAFAVSSSGISNTYSSASEPTTLATVAVGGGNTTNVCVQKDQYSYISPTCKNSDGSPLSIEFYQMLNASSCQVTYCPGNGYDYDNNLITSGQVNLLCKLGTGNTAQCDCPAGKEYWASRYVVENSDLSGICLEDCAELNMVETFPGSKVCTCPSGSVWDPQIQKCMIPGQCTEDYLKWDEIKAQCICKTELELLSMDRYYFGSCEVYDSTLVNDGCKRLLHNWEKVNGQCVCPIPFTENGKNCTCEDPRTQNGDVCACDFDKVAPTLAEDEIFVNDDYNPTCKIKCDTENYYFPNATKTACVQNIPQCGCLEKLVGMDCVCNEDITIEQLQQCADLKEGNIFDATAPECQVECKGTSFPDATLKECACDCLKTYDGNTCVCDPTQADSTQCINPDEKFDGTSSTCKVCKEPNREYDDNGACVCKPIGELNLADNQIYNPALSSCVYTCKDGAVANAGHTACIGGCLEVYNYETEKLECIQNPSDEVTKECLKNTNFVSDPSLEACKVECSELTSPNDVHKVCACDATKVETALNKSENLNKIYALDNAPVCMMACQGQTIPREDRMACKPVDCLYETTDNITQHCIENPTDELTKACLENTNLVSAPTAATCSVECTGLTSPDNVHKSCPCDNAKVTTELAKPQNLNKIYALDNAPVCMLACTGQTFPQDDRMACRPVDCLYETKDNIAQYCIENPTDEQTTACLAGTNYKSNPLLEGCREDCGNIRVPNNVYKSCECSAEKMENYYSSDEMKFDPTSATCESACPENQERDPQNPAQCICKPAAELTFGTYEIYMPTAQSCKYTCKDGAVADEAHMACVGPCLKEYNYETEKLQCVQNPSDELTTKCLAGTNFVSAPQDPTDCMIECETLTSPNAVHKFCPCNAAKVEIALEQPENANKIYDLDHSPACMKPCTGQTIPKDDRTACRPVDCLYETKDNVTQQCIKNPSDELTTYCLQGTNYKSNPALEECREDCGDRRIPNEVYKVCECSVDKMADKYSGNNMKYDPLAQNCESACPTNFVATDDKMDCVCGLNDNSCGAGTYFDSASCSCKPCELGHYCPGGTQPIKCPCGTYGAATSLTTDACSGVCAAGYRCPEGSTTATAVACEAGQTCPAGTCTPGTCQLPFTSSAPFTHCNDCMTEAAIKKAQPDYFKQNEVWVDDVATFCKKCKSNMVYDAQGQCVCPADKPYWNGSSCQTCQVWGTLYFARQETNNPSCTLYNHMNGSTATGCFGANRIPDKGMAKAASMLSAADKNRTFGNGVYAYMVAMSPDGKSASVVGVFTARSWYHTFPGDLSSYSTNKNAQAGGSCKDMCAGNAECVNTCNYMTGKVTANTMFGSCKYVVNNQYYGQSYGAADELCSGGKISTKDGCAYNVGALMRRVTSPLVLDINGDGLKYTSAEDGVIFDLDNDGNPEQTAWTTAQSEFDNAFLVLDKNKNGQVDNGGELFGDQNGEENGFLELAKYDSNGDGVINSEDEVFNELLLWVDYNKNGVVDYNNDGTTNELKTLAEANVVELSVKFGEIKDADGNLLTDAFGNITGLVGTFKMMIVDAAGKLVEVVRTMMDVFFTSIQAAFN